MKKILTLLTFSLFLVNIALSQSFQRMAIAKGSYKLSARGSTNVTAYCLDFSRKAPSRGMNYGNILSGGSRAVVRIVSSAGDISTMGLDDAISKGYVAVEGVNAFEGRGKKVLEEIVQTARLMGESTDEYEQIIKGWDNLPISEQARIEDQLALAMGMSETTGNHTALKFVNKTSNEIEIKLENNLELGSDTERIPVGGLGDYDLSSDAAKQDAIQREIVWVVRENQNLETLKKLGYYEGDTKVTKDDFEGVKKIYKDIQKNNDIRHSGEDFGVFDEIMESWAMQQQKNLESELDQIGFVGDFDSAIKAYQKYKGKKQTGNFSQSLKNSLKADIEKGIFISTKGKVYNTKIIKTSSGEEKVIILNPNLYVKFSNRKSIDLIETNLNSRQYLQEEIEVISLVKDDETNSILKLNFPDNHLTFSMPSMRDLIKNLKTKKRKSIFIVGHIEGKEFVTPLTGGEEFRLSLQDLKRLGDELDINIFPMGCNSGVEGTGLGNKFNSIDALNRLKPAIEDNNTVMGMLGDLAGDDLKIIIDEVPFQDRGYLQAKIQREERIENGVAILVGGGAAGLIIYNSSTDR